MKWSDNWCGSITAELVSTERDTGFEPATSSLGSWLQHCETLENRDDWFEQVGRPGLRSTTTGHTVVREVV